MTSSFTSLASVEVPKLHENRLFMPSWGYGLMAFCIFVLLFAFLMAFRNTAARFGGQQQNSGHGKNAHHTGAHEAHASDGNAH